MYISACVYVSNANAKSTGTWFRTQTISNRERQGCRGCLPKPIAPSSRNAEAGGTLINLDAKVGWQLINLNARYRIAKLNTRPKFPTKIKLLTRMNPGLKHVQRNSQINPKYYVYIGNKSHLYPWLEKDSGERFSTLRNTAPINLGDAKISFFHQ